MTRTVRIIAASALTLVAFTFFGVTLVHAVFYNPDSEITVPQSAITQQVTAGDYPDTLVIPALNIHAAVQDVGITKAGNMGTPNNFTDVGWYKYGPVPGQEGSAVITGHLDNALALDGVFKHLSDLKVGDDVYIMTKGGSNLHFKVIDTEEYPYTDAPTDKIFGDQGYAAVNLITCGGVWIQAKKSYDQRLVVYTKFIPSS